ncbi:MAG: hypothetical protein LIO54_08710 [Oscillospiraceae bacterium]|nr:hypothetical protein [Oscillospiraceae bacterium]
MIVLKFENTLHLCNAEILPNFYGFVNIFRINKIQRAFCPDMAQQKYALPQAFLGLRRDILPVWRGAK